MFLITGLYAAILGLLLVWLSIQVIGNRRKYEVAYGDGGHDELIQTRSAHTNFAQYVPLALILIAMAEAADAPGLLLHLLGLALVVGRVIHAVGVTKPIMKYRVIGMIMTFIVLAVSSLTNLWLSAQGLMGG